MSSSALVVVSALGIGGSHAFLLWRLVATPGLGGGSTRLVRGALLLRLLPVTTLLAAIWWGSAEAALATLGALWLGRAAVVTGLQVWRE